MKKNVLAAGLSMLAMVACGGGPKGVKDVGQAINKPTATITRNGTEKALADDQAAKENAQKAGGAVPSFGGAVKFRNIEGLQQAAQLAGIAGQYDMVNAISLVESVARQQDNNTQEETNPADYFCKEGSPGKQALDNLKSASNSGSGGGCSVAFELTPTCNADKTVFTLKYRGAINCSGSSVEQLRNLNYDITVSMKLGKQDGAYAYMSVVDGKATYEGKTYTFIGGGGYIREGAKAAGVGVFFINGTDSCVFYTSTDNGTGVAPTSGATLCLKGANGLFVIQCKENSDKVECALWKDSGGTLTLEGSTINPAPETPSTAKCNDNPLLAKFAKFLDA